MISKIIKLDDLLAKLVALRAEGKRMVFTNGCFDILHTGHVRYLAEAKASGEVLVVGMNSDSSVKSIKDVYRPVIPQNHRAEVLAALESVDFVIIFDSEPELLDLITALRPDVLVKGADWAEDDIEGADFVKSTGGSIVRIPLVPDISTTKIIEMIINSYRKDPEKSG